jgi:hypothetical protein
MKRGVRWVAAKQKWQAGLIVQDAGRWRYLRAGRHEVVAHAVFAVDVCTLLVQRHRMTAEDAVSLYRQLRPAPDRPVADAAAAVAQTRQTRQQGQRQRQRRGMAPAATAAGAPAAASGQKRGPHASPAVPAAKRAKTLPLLSAAQQQQQPAPPQAAQQQQQQPKPPQQRRSYGWYLMGKGRLQEGFKPPQRPAAGAAASGRKRSHDAAAGPAAKRLKA